MYCKNLSVLLILIIPIILFAQDDWAEHTIDEDFYGAFFVYAIDLDGDNDVDVLGSAYSDNDITWWENEGGIFPNFTEHTIADNFEGAISVYAVDLDGDDDVDVLGSAYSADDITWWENDGTNPPTFTEHTLISNFDGASSVYAIDIDDDNDVDVLATARVAGDITWFENDGGNPPSFTEHIIANTFGGAYSVYAIDIDGDDDIDVLGAARDADDITWFENDGGNPPSFTEHTIAGGFDAAYSVYAIDLDGDSDVDVLGAAHAADDIAWWENDGSSPPNFTKHTVDDNFDGASSVYAIDLDDDSDVDILGAADAANDVSWWENDGISPPQFTRHTITDNFTGVSCIYAIDLNNDGNVDILGAGFSVQTIAWWERAIHDVGPISIDIPALLPVDTTFYPKVTVKNFGNDIENFAVTCKINPGGYSRTRIVDSLVLGDSVQVTFQSEFTFEYDTHTVTVCTGLAEDVNFENDTLEKIIVTYTGIAEANPDKPLSFSFGLKNNPAKNKAIFNLTLPEPASISLQIYDASGRLVDELKTHKSAGNYEIPWTPKETAGVYFYRFESPIRTEFGKLILIK
jgi:hypothetical protein